MKTLTSWIGTNDLDAAEGKAGAGRGAIVGVLSTDRYERAVLIANQDPARVKAYEKWLRQQEGAPFLVALHQVQLPDPTDVERIMEVVHEVLETEKKDVIHVPEWTFNFSSGTPAMALVWGILSLTKYPGRLAQASRDHGAKIVTLPFDLAAEYVPRRAERPSTALLLDAAPDLRFELIPEHAPRREFGEEVLRRDFLSDAFAGYQFKSAAMARLLKRAQRAAASSFPVLIEGEVGTEKELLARHIHEHGPRRRAPFVTFDCAAYAPGEIHCALFGSNEDGAGSIWYERRGTIYVDNIDRLPERSQALLGQLLDRTRETALPAVIRDDVRVICASSKSLIAAMVEGRLLEAAFFAIATIVLKLPPLRERQGDLGPLIERILEQVNETCAKDPGFEPRRLSPGAKNVFLQHSWPGNLRELESTVRRAAIMASGPKISEAEAWEALLRAGAPSEGADDLLSKPVEGGVDLNEIMSHVARRYLTRAMEVAEGNKTEAAKLLNMSSYQTLSNWLTRYNVD